MQPEEVEAVAPDESVVDPGSEDKTNGLDEEPAGAVENEVELPANTPMTEDLPVEQRQTHESLVEGGDASVEEQVEKTEFSGDDNRNSEVAKESTILGKRGSSEDGESPPRRRGCGSNRQHAATASARSINIASQAGQEVPVEIPPVQLEEAEAESSNSSDDVCSGFQVEDEGLMTDDNSNSGNEDPFIPVDKNVIKVSAPFIAEAEEPPAADGSMIVQGSGIHEHGEDDKADADKKPQSLASDKPKKTLEVKGPLVLAKSMIETQLAAQPTSKKDLSQDDKKADSEDEDFYGQGHNDKSKVASEDPSVPVDAVKAGAPLLAESDEPPATDGSKTIQYSGAKMNTRRRIASLI